ncbi:MAG: NAD(P)H-binding protein [Lactobacillus sp.]|nr:NAD(P)H-binding protein [Limosilactobacillus mucosae]MDC2841372.1 NAD(P)H-binding protein [Limosilactobacillus mucosae]MDD6865313.1 NAD(P)H-binding protein [Lactobacillus sp.]
MTRVLIIGATGTLGSAVRQMLLDQTDDELTLFARSANQIQTGAREKAISGNVMNDADLDQAMQGQDAVFAALSGNLELFAKKSRLQWIATMFHGLKLSKLPSNMALRILLIITMATLLIKFLN